MKKVFSPQDVMGCSEYAQGCDGGFPYLIAGKYAEDFGVVEEQCFPYLAHNSKCDEKSGCQRYQATNYKYVGGYFGACNEQEMMMALQDGPVSVAFEVTADFQQYRGGIYQHTGLTDKFNPVPTHQPCCLADWLRRGEWNQVLDREEQLGLCLGGAWLLQDHQGDKRAQH